MNKAPVISERIKPLLKYIDFRELRYYTAMQNPKQSKAFARKIEEIGKRVDQISLRYIEKRVPGQEIALILSEFQFMWHSDLNLLHKGLYATESGDQGATGLAKLIDTFEKSPANILEIDFKFRNPSVNLREYEKEMKNVSEDEFGHKKIPKGHNYDTLKIKGKYILVETFMALRRHKETFKQAAKFEEAGHDMIKGKTVIQQRLAYQVEAFKTLKQYFSDKAIELKKPKQLPTLFAELIQIVGLLPKIRDNYVSDNEYFRKRGRQIFDRATRKR